jgi:hypothetical protein
LAAQAPFVLVLNSYHPQYTWTEELVRGVRDELANLPPENLHIEFMDARRMVDDEKYLDLLADVYRHKYGRFRPASCRPGRRRLRCGRAGQSAARAFRASV